MALPEHSKLINKVAKNIFTPKGLSRKGQSRMWLDDQGWFTTVIEFQPFTNRMGTCLNIGVNFHWYYNDYWSFDIGYRESDFLDFFNEQQFVPNLEKLTKLALAKTLNYRELLKNLESAKATILHHNFSSEDLWGSYHKGIICGLHGDMKSLNQYFDKLLKTNHDVPWANELKERVVKLKDLVDNYDDFIQEIIDIISQTRMAKKLPDKVIKIK